MISRIIWLVILAVAVYFSVKSAFENKVIATAVSVYVGCLMLVCLIRELHDGKKQRRTEKTMFNL